MVHYDDPSTTHTAVTRMEQIELEEGGTTIERSRRPKDGTNSQHTAARNQPHLIPSCSGEP